MVFFDKSTFAWTIVITSTLSVLAGVFIILCFVFHKPLQKSFAFNLVIYLTIADLTTTLARFLVLPTS